MNPKQQLSLFSHESIGTYAVSLPSEVAMGCEALQAWKQRLFQYQQQVHLRPPVEQVPLFDLPATPTAPDPDRIDPFALPQQNIEFWRWKFDNRGETALYFVIDYELPIILYVGETSRSNKRWKGFHDCKRYLLNYRQAHYAHHLSTALGIAFWFQAPADTRQRQGMELDLIYKWRSPFNKENWDFWGTPFTGGKV
ncbi:hypothetical protein BST81_03455 [Leptolyngbya sp. 'hensonii']|uniref:hypothetical protein n=1 Tax=Leptolyngbya sp. 'hensonii' TaxID=1922337 RepID=UPI00094F7D2A|nr:hypothetical protein [Leptolyngbya sp. 'hensonii']OLP19843.1 hypothetical protein BST81_03455 [Leptolyngbya sp. 'hensonii']